MNQNLLEIYEELEEVANIGWWSFDIQDQSLTWSPQTYQIHGVPVNEELDPAQAIEFYLPKYREKIQANFEKCINKGTSYAGDFEIKTRNGEIKWVRSYGRAHIENGIITRVYGTFQDITSIVKIKGFKNKLATKVLEQSSIINSIAIVAETDLQGNITYVNELFEEVSGYKKEEVIGQNHRMLNSGTHPKEFFEELWETIQFGVTWRGQICNKRKDGSLYWVETFIQSKRDSEGEIVGYTSLRYDITKQKELEAEMREHMENSAMVAQLASVGEFAGSIAHEISNPLTIISMVNEQIAKRNDGDERLLKSTDSIRKASRRIENIIKGMKSLLYRAKQEEFKPASINKVVREMEEFSSEFLNSKGIELRLDYDSADSELDCIDVQLSQVLINMVKNSRDAILESKSTERWIAIKVESDSDQIYIEISDSGPGIESEFKDKVMQTYFTTKEKGKGTGLGLSLVNRIIDKHNGSLELKSSSPAVFFITLPKKYTSMKAA